MWGSGAFFLGEDERTVMVTTWLNHGDRESAEGGFGELPVRFVVHWDGGNFILSCFDKRGR